MTLKIMLKYILFVLVFFVISCKPGNQNSQAEREREIQEISSESEVEILSESPEDMNAAAEAILNFRIKQDSESYAAIEMDRWYCKFIAEGSRIFPVRDDQWLDFYPDLTYEYGNNKGVNGRGRYHYRFLDGKLLMVDDDKKVKPKEFDAKIKGPSMVLVGTPTYKDNHIQMKFEMDNVSRNNDTQ